MIYPDVYLALPDPLTGGPGPVQTSEFEAGPGDGAALLHIEWSLRNATGPNPPDGQIDVWRDTDLSWTAGIFAAATNGHTVYFGESFNDVNDGVGGSIQTATSHDPGRLNYGTKYYWRVRENNGAPDFGTNEGRVWSFTTEFFSYRIDGENIIVTASSVSQASFGPENTINGSGLDPNDLHDDERTAMWLSSIDDPEPWIRYDFDKAYKLHDMKVWNHNSESESTLGYGIQQARIETSVDGETWTELDGLQTFNQAPGAMDYAANTTVPLGGVIAQFVRITALSNWSPWPDIFTQKGLSEVQFSDIPVRARKPDPDSGATGVDVDVVLGWRAGREAATHNVSFSADEQAVIDDTAPVTAVATANYSPPALDLSTSYYWKVVEVNEAETPSTWERSVLSFTTSDHIVVDDFESYNDIVSGEPGSNLVYETWLDGYGITTNGSAMGYTVPFEPTMETDTVHGGQQSAPLEYNNTTAAFLEAARTLAPQNWTDNGIQILTLWFRGNPGNTPGQLYVKINGVQVDYNGDSTNLGQALWQLWPIDLTSVGGLQSVTSLAIGVQGFGATGTLLLDDIGLYRSAPEVVNVSAVLNGDFEYWSDHPDDPIWAYVTTIPDDPGVGWYVHDLDDSSTGAKVRICASYTGGSYHVPSSRITLAGSPDVRVSNTCPYLT